MHAQTGWHKWPVNGNFNVHKYITQIKRERGRAKEHQVYDIVTRTCAHAKPDWVKACVSRDPPVVGVGCWPARSERVISTLCRLTHLAFVSALFVCVHFYGYSTLLQDGAARTIIMLVLNIQTNYGITVNHLM